jgi:hypothetical protein
MHVYVCACNTSRVHVSTDQQHHLEAHRQRVAT